MRYTTLYEYKGQQNALCMLSQHLKAKIKRSVHYQHMHVKVNYESWNIYAKLLYVCWTIIFVIIIIIIVSMVIKQTKMFDFLFKKWFMQRVYDIGILNNHG